MKDDQKIDITIDEAAARWGISSKTIRRAIKSGSLPSYPLNSRVIRLTEVDVSVWYLSHRRQCPQVARTAD